MAAEHEFVKTKSTNEFENALRPPPGPSGFVLAGKLFTALQAAVGHTLTLDDLVARLGGSRSGLHRWFASGSHPHLERLCRIMEQMSREARQRFWDEVCRTLPDLHHPRLAHDPHAVAQLRALLGQPCGLTWIVGNRPASSFLLTALGHAFRQGDPAHRDAVGISKYLIEAHVPLAQVVYLPPLASPPQEREIVLRLWPQLQRRKSPLILLDGVGAEGVGDDLLNLARNRHVILTGKPEPTLLATAQRQHLPLHTIKVSMPATANAPITVLVCSPEP